MISMGFRTRSHRYFATVGFTVILLSVSFITYYAEAHACQQQDFSVSMEETYQRTAYRAPENLGLPNRREPGGTR